MPAELLERPVEVEEKEKSQDALKPKAFSHSRYPEARTEPGQTLLHRIFEGREEFLGCTPD
jgi:hypothetical protein